MEPFVNLSQIKTIKDEVVNIPKISWKVELNVLKCLSDGLKRVPSLMDTLSDENPNIVKVLPQLFETMPDILTQMSAEILRKDNAWIEENLDAEGILELLGPFFTSFIKKVTSKIPTLTTTGGSKKAKK